MDSCSPVSKRSALPLFNLNRSTLKPSCRNISCVNQTGGFGLCFSRLPIFLFTSSVLISNPHSEKYCPEAWEMAHGSMKYPPVLGYTMFSFGDRPGFSARTKYCGILFDFCLVGWTRRCSSRPTWPFFLMVSPFSRLLSVRFKMEQDSSALYKLGPYYSSTQQCCYISHGVRVSIINLIFQRFIAQP